MRDPFSGAAQFSFSSEGSLVYISSGAVESSLVWVDRRGVVEPLPFDSAVYADPRLSSDGLKLAVTVNGQDVWSFDVVRGSRVRLTDGNGSNFEPIWTPDDSRVAFSSSRTGVPNLFWTLADGRGQIERLSESENRQFPNSWTSDGAVLLFTSGAALQTQTWTLDLSTREIAPFLDAPFGEWTAKLSPDDRWLAYVSDESGHPEVYVQSYPGRDLKIPISTEGGTEPVWSRDGGELFYRNGEEMLAVTFTTEPRVAVSSPATLFEKPFELTAPGYPNYDVHPDGQRFVMIERSEDGSVIPGQVNVVFNWFQDLAERVPVP